MLSDIATLSIYKISPFPKRPPFDKHLFFFKMLPTVGSAVRCDLRGGGLPTPRFVLLSNNICHICPCILSNRLLIWFQIEFLYPFPLLILGNCSVKIFKLTLVKILLCLLNREYRIEQISVEFLAL